MKKTYLAPSVTAEVFQVTDVMAVSEGDNFNVSDLLGEGGN